MEATHPKRASPRLLQPGNGKRNLRRARRYHAILNGEMFADFIPPVTPAQIEKALAYLDQNFGRWEANRALAAWDYVLPALHKLFPQQKRFGFTAPFGPVKPPSYGLVQRLCRYVFGHESSAESVRRESPEAR